MAWAGHRFSFPPEWIYGVPSPKLHSSLLRWDLSSSIICGYDLLSFSTRLFDDLNNELSLPEFQLVPDVGIGSLTALFTCASLYFWLANSLWVSLYWWLAKILWVSSAFWLTTNTMGFMHSMVRILYMDFKRDWLADYHWVSRDLWLAILYWAPYLAWLASY